MYLDFSKKGRHAWYVDFFIRGAMHGMWTFAEWVMHVSRFSFYQSCKQSLILLCLCIGMFENDLKFEERNDIFFSRDHAYGSKKIRRAFSNVKVCGSAADSPNGVTE